jgi:hypothetical protein
MAGFCTSRQTSNSIGKHQQRSVIGFFRFRSGKSTTILVSFPKLAYIGVARCLNETNGWFRYFFPWLIW